MDPPVRLCVNAGMQIRVMTFGIGLSLAACATGPTVLGSEDLPVRRIVMYRNGVAYIERSGEFSGEALSFFVRAPDVGDFLSSLTAVALMGAIQSL